MDRLTILKDAMLSSASDAIVAADIEGLIFFWNSGAERIFGHKSADAVGQSLDIIIPERLRARHWQGYSRVVNDDGKSRYGRGDVLAVPGITKNGRAISLEFTIISLRAHTGQFVGFAAIMRDVTTRFEEMRALKERMAAITKAESP